MEWGLEVDWTEFKLWFHYKVADVLKKVITILKAFIYFLLNKDNNTDLTRSSESLK